MRSHEYDIVVVGGGTSGCFASATAAQAGLDVVLLERKDEEEAGHIACGDAIKGKSTFPDVVDLDYLREESFTNEGIERAAFESPSGEVLDIPFKEAGAVIDRWTYGQVLLEETERAGTAVHYDTVVQDVVQAEDGRVTGVKAMRNGDVHTYEGEFVLDAAGALSFLQDKTDFSDSTFDTNVDYSQFCSAYREVVEVPEPVDYDDAIVFKPTEELGYLWYFPRSSTEINAGLGFQMNKPSMPLVDVLKDDLENRPEFQGATVKDKLGAALPTRRPYDSATHPGYIAIGDAAGHVNPCTGGGIPGAAKGGHWAAAEAIDAIAEGRHDEAAVWEYNRKVQTDFGKRFAAMDIYNIWGGTHDVRDLVSIISSLPGQQLVDALGNQGTSSMSLGLKLRTVVNSFGHWGELKELYDVHKLAGNLKDVYDQYPEDPDGFETWRSTRDELLNDLYEITGADPKY